MARALNYLKQHPETLWLTAILALSMLLRLAFLHEPFEIDEGQYATIAQEILRGGLPYRDAIEIKPPAVFYLYALAISLFGATSEGIRIFTTLYSLLTVIAVYGVARQISGVRAGISAALVHGIFSTFPLIQGSGCNTEVFLVLPLTAGVWFLLMAFETESCLYLYGVSLCAILAMLIKPVALPVVALELLLIPFIRSGPGRIKDTVLDLTAFMIPIAACAGAVLAYFYLRGCLDDFLYWTVEFPRRYNNAGLSGPTLGFILLYLTSSLLVPILLGIPTALWLAFSKRTISGILPLLLILAVCLAIAIPGKYFPHYFILLIPFLAIPAGIGIASITAMPRQTALMALLVLLVTISFSIWKNYKFYTVYSPETVSIEKYGTTRFVDSVRIAYYLREHTGPDDYIFQWGMEPELYFLSGRRCPNPYLVSLVPGWSKDPPGAVSEMMQSLMDKNPPYIVVQPEWAEFEGKLEVYAYLQMSCVEEKVIGYAHIFRCSSKQSTKP